MVRLDQGPGHYDHLSTTRQTKEVLMNQYELFPTSEYETLLPLPADVLEEDEQEGRDDRQLEFDWEIITGRE